MEYEKLLPIISCWKKPITFSKLQGGLTNVNFLVKEGKQRYIARFAPSSNKFLGLERKREIANTAAAWKIGIGPEFKAYYPEYDLLILKYVPGKTCTPELARKPKTIKLIAKVLRQLHQSKPFQGTINPVTYIRNSISAVQQKGSWASLDIKKLLLDLEFLEQRLGFNASSPCHLDLMIENLILSKSSLKIIDWEYSANSDPRFDLAMVSYKGNFEPEQDALLLAEYGQPELFQEMQMMKAVVALREVAWSLIQIAFSTVPRDYRSYAEIDLERFRTLMTALKFP